MKKVIHGKKAILWGIIVWLIQMVLGNLLCMNPLVIKINQQFEGHPTVKSFNFLGGMTNWIILTLLFGTIFTAICIFLYLILVQLFNTLVSFLIFGSVLGFFYKRFSVISIR